MSETRPARSDWISDDPQGEPFIGAWVFSWHGHGSGGRIDTWIYRNEDDALRATAAALSKMGMDAVTERLEEGDSRGAIEAFNDDSLLTRIDVRWVFCNDERGAQVSFRDVLD